MGTSEVDKIFGKLDDIADRMARVETKQDAIHSEVSELKTDVKTIALNGCSKAVIHADHESRIRAIEGQSRLMTGGVGAGGVGVGAVIVAVLQWLMGK